MKGVCAVLFLIVVTVPCFSRAAGFAHDANFIVLAPDQSAAEDVLTAANDFRREVAKEWLGEELPPSVGRTVISVTFVEQEDRGLTWAIDDARRTMHKLWLRTTPDRAVSSTLGHEIVHVVLASQYPDALPAWADEGAAGTQDDQHRIDIRTRTIAWYARTSNWPSLQTVFDMPTISGEDQATYSVAASVTGYLLTRGDRTKFLRFAMAGKTQGWDRALREYYSLDSVRTLQAAWQDWAKQLSERNLVDTLASR